MLISCSRTAVGCETSTSPDCTFDNDPGFFSLDTHSVWAADPMRAVPFSTSVRNRTQNGFLGLCFLEHACVQLGRILGAQGLTVKSSPRSSETFCRTPSSSHGPGPRSPSG